MVRVIKTTFENIPELGDRGLLSRLAQILEDRVLERRRVILHETRKLEELVPAVRQWSSGARPECRQQSLVDLYIPSGSIIFNLPLDRANDGLRTSSISAGVW